MSRKVANGSARTCVRRAGVTYGAQPDRSGPIGGGAGYRRVVRSGRHTARTVDELIAALAAARAGETVFIPGDATLDFTDRVFLDGLVLKLPAGVVLAGDRGWRGSAGALLFSDAFQTSPLIEVAGPGARITGLRLRGPDPKRRLAFHHRAFYTDVYPAGPARSDAYYRFPNSDAIRCGADRLEVDNCEIAGWSHAGVYLPGGLKHRVHHCFIHHCQRMGLGYGVCLDQAEVLIERNLFQDNKHHIAGTGRPGSGYEARHNVVLPYTEAHAHPVTGAPYGQDHLFDMHGGGDRRDGTEVAGAWMKIHHNRFRSSYLAVCIRGVPERKALIHHNWFDALAPGDGVVRAKGRTDVRSNVYGPAGRTVA